MESYEFNNALNSARENNRALILVLSSGMENHNAKYDIKLSLNKKGMENGYLKKEDPVEITKIFGGKPLV